MTRCAKHRYRDKIAAELVIIKIRTKPGREIRPKYECRAYYCGNCHGWHLTSKQERKSA